MVAYRNTAKCDCNDDHHAVDRDSVELTTTNDHDHEDDVADVDADASADEDAPKCGSEYTRGCECDFEQRLEVEAAKNQAVGVVVVAAVAVAEPVALAGAV